MIPIFIWITEYLTGEKRLINFAYVLQMRENVGKDATVLYLPENQKLMIRESMKELDDQLERHAVEIRLACWKTVAEGKELL